MPSITARELREHFTPRPEPDYFEVTVRAARRQAAQVQPITHWNSYDAPMHHGRQQAACGEHVALANISGEPTCPACRQQLAIYESLQF